METPESQEELGARPTPQDRMNRPTVSESTSRTVTANVSRQVTSEDSIEEEEPSTKKDAIHETSSRQSGHLHCKPIYLEPPPVVRRPPKIKNDSFRFTTSWFSWDRSEQRDGLYCARSIHKLYSYSSNVRLFGINFSRTLAVNFTNEGVDSATEVVRFGGQEWRNDRSSEAKHRIAKYTHGQRKDMEAAATRSATHEQADPEKKSVTDLEGQTEAAPALAKQEAALHRHPYIVVGFMGDESVPKETLRRIIEPDHLFRELRRAHTHLRKPYRRIFSLKECAGFSIYECDSAKGYHREMELDRETERSLMEMWRSYRGHKVDYEGRWLQWIHQNFNNGSNNPEEGRLTLEFKLRWSVPKVVLFALIPVLLSLAVGFWYMYSDHGEVTDRVAIAEAAWVIATYIITTSALLLALLAVITQFGDV